MLSRVAESIYWMNRYIERADNVARFVLVNLHLMLDIPGGGVIGVGGQWQPLIWTTGDDKLFLKRYPEPGSENVMQFLTFDGENPNSIISCIRSARENARTIRESISSEMWITLNRFYLLLTDPDAPTRAANDPHAFYSDIRTACSLFAGEAEGTMSHGEGYHFGEIAKMIERADKTSRILDVKYFILLPKVENVGMPIDTLQWAALLKSASALEMYRKQYATITPKRVSEFLLLNREFPRAVRYCLGRIEDSLRAITGTSLETFSNPAEQKLGRLLADMTYTNIDEITKNGLHEYIDSLQLRLNTLDDAIYHTFFEVKPVETVKVGSEEEVTI